MIEPEQVAVPEVAEMEGNRMADMPENAEEKPCITARSIHVLCRPANPKTNTVELPPPYEKEGPGMVYINWRADWDVVCSLFAGEICPTDALLELEVKVGFTDDIRRRIREYQKCENGVMIGWVVGFMVEKRKHVERITHNCLAEMDIEPCIYRCPGCGVRHEEYYPFWRLGGFQVLEDVIRLSAAMAGQHKAKSTYQFGAAPVWSLLSPPTELKDALRRHAAVNYATVRGLVSAWWKAARLNGYGTLNKLDSPRPFCKWSTWPLSWAWRALDEVLSQIECSPILRRTEGRPSSSKSRQRHHNERNFAVGEPFSKKRNHGRTRRPETPKRDWVLEDRRKTEP
ncbi:hypothetical protein DFH07DRAFT_785353 [Mycena maculata]|uniref:Bacteriophage T5 Orf172 DNA-binding domain-containing protein n=1 Tax=Mycena maculata TaxID=230809 RepID=A0AAD7HCF6_9AGAR|nr:hypothetical protein DFH07DRAFT_785353 [Mycena maculata]